MESLRDTLLILMTFVVPNLRNCSCYHSFRFSSWQDLTSTTLGNTILLGKQGNLLLPLSGHHNTPHILIIKIEQSDISFAWCPYSALRHICRWSCGLRWTPYCITLSHWFILGWGHVCVFQVFMHYLKEVNDIFRLLWNPKLHWCVRHWSFNKIQGWEFCTFCDV